MKAREYAIDATQTQKPRRSAAAGPGTIAGHEQELGTVFKRLDSDKSGRLDYGEFERAVRSELRVTDTTDQELKALWAYVDHDKSGEVTIKEFQHGCYLLILEGWPLLAKDSLEKIVAIINGAAKRWLHASSWVTVFRAIDQDENPVGLRRARTRREGERHARWPQSHYIRSHGS